MPQWTVRPYVRLLSALFVAALLLGFFILSPARLERAGAGELRFLAEPYRSLPPVWMFLYVFLNNALKAFVVLLLGLALGVLPVMTAAAEGLVLGAAFRYHAVTGGFGKAALLMLPHSLIEVPAVLIAASYGLWLGAAVFRRIRRGARADLGGRIRHALAMYVRVVVPLFAVAALVETVVRHVAA
jgi:stage II sporulation protein M